MERLTMKNSDGTYSQPTHTTFEKMFYKLAEIEDFMEEMGFESLEELKNRLNKRFHIQDDDVRQGKVFNGVFFSNEQLIVMNEWTEFNTHFQNKYYDKSIEVQSLKLRWRKLKEWLDEDITNGEYYFKLIKKMQELESNNE